ncbi:phage integrase SAM-like domain-containing protein [Mariniplasma anaerobium]|uniref:Uncharacterized protein n=1 Tax=Mariniplasma anaerobium TaxID=2735436 RepID=A0A7U9TL42_9MOLU|nr:phage integrase SAM-like domain-containing protein [Mariniplasma anaerobium]BCR35550.1 hypothetical protein MPAN_004430 [Mariniplasma anaerobium]
MKIQELVNNYLMEIKLRYAKGTHRFYQSHLGHFVNYANDNQITTIEDLNSEFIVDYIYHMKETCQNVTINKNIGCLKRMYNYMEIDFPYLQQIKNCVNALKRLKLLK